MSTANQTIKNLANDLGIDLPSKFSRLETAAAIMADFREKKGHFPDRHEFISHIEIYQKSLPGDKIEAAVLIAEAAAKLLGMPGLKSDAERIRHARGIIAQAEIDAADAEACRGQRLSRIHSLETQLADERRCLEAWNIDFISEAEKADRLIVENWGRTTVVAPFDDLQTLAVLKRLAPTAIKEISAKIADAQAELEELKKA